MDKPTFERIWSRYVLAVKRHHPFFSAVSMFTSCRLSELPIGKISHDTLLISPTFFSGLSEPQQFSYLLHQVIHLALLHPARGFGRDQALWNVASDIVTNCIIIETTNWQPAPLTASDSRFSGCSVEKAYATLLTHFTSEYGHGSAVTNTSEQQPKGNNELFSNAGEYWQNHYNCSSDFEVSSNHSASSNNGGWQLKLQMAKQLANANRKAGTQSASLIREIDDASSTQLNWRSLLWHFATPSAVDFHEFDHRLIHQGYYLEKLDGEHLNIDVVIDTSGSIRDRELSLFLSEIRAIRSIHPHICIRLFYADTELYGPYEMPADHTALPALVGGGGTSFVPYFTQQVADGNLLSNPVATIYFTDGYGEFPLSAPRIPVLWIVPEDCKDEIEFPFGEVAYISI